VSSLVARELSRDDYHADADGPTLSASIAHILCTASPLHAWTAHPALNPNHTPVEKDHYDFGTAVHAVLLEGVEICVPIEAADWRTNAAKEAREQTRAEGRIPLLAHDYTRLLQLVSAAKRQLADHHASPRLFTDGKPEQSLFWHEPDGVACRARIDWLRDDFVAIDDLKTTSASANPDLWSRRLFDHGVDVQSEMYRRGAERLTGVRPEFRLVVIETTEPFALSVVSPGPDVELIARKKVDYAIALWEKCLRENSWPGYARDVAYAALPAYEESRWLEREIREAA
jgi:hypothetical protein